MKLIPPPPPMRGTELAVSQRSVVVSLRHGVCSGCVMCGQSTVQYWPHEGRFHPVHPGCAWRLLEHWEAMLATGDEHEDGPRSPAPAPPSAGRGGRGAYGRRAAQSGRGTAATPSSAIAPVIPDAVQGNPFWRPGMEPDQPWMVVTESTVGRTHAPRLSRESALGLLAFQEQSARLDRPDGVILLGGAVVAPDTTIVADWGAYEPPFGLTYFQPLEKVGGGMAYFGWTQCRDCDEWLWPGCWITQGTQQCRACAAPADRGRPWPVEAAAPGGRSEPPEPVKVRAKKKATSFD